MANHALYGIKVLSIIVVILESDPLDFINVIFVLRNLNKNISISIENLIVFLIN